MRFRGRGIAECESHGSCAIETIENRRYDNFTVRCEEETMNGFAPEDIRSCLAMSVDAESLVELSVGGESIDVALAGQDDCSIVRVNQEVDEVTILRCLGRNLKQNFWGSLAVKCVG